MTKLKSSLQQLVYYQYLQNLGQLKLSKQHIKQINIIHVTKSCSLSFFSNQ